MVELLSARLLKAKSRHVGASAEPRTTIDLYHDRIREAVYARLAPDERVRLHQRLATSIERREPLSARDLEALLRHWSAAGARARRRALAQEAAERAAEQLAFQRAALLHRVVLDEPDPREGPLEVAARWTRVGELHQLVGEYGEASEAYQRALQRWEAAPADALGRDQALLHLRGSLGLSQVSAGATAAGRATFAQAMSQLGLRLHGSPRRQLMTLLWLRLLIALVAALPRRRRPMEGGVRAQQIFFDRMFNAMLVCWPLVSGESALRRQLLGLRYDDQAIRFRSLLSQAMIAALMMTPTRRRIERAREALDTAEAILREQAIPNGEELLQFYRGVLWFPTDLKRSERAVRDAFEGLRRKGQHNAVDGAMMRMFHIIALSARSEAEEALTLIREEMTNPRLNFNSIPNVMLLKLRLHLARGELAEGWDTLRRFEELLREHDVPAFDLAIVTARCIGLNALGRFEEARSVITSYTQPTAVNPLAFSNAMWAAATLDTFVGLSGRRRLTRSEQARARRVIRALVGYPVVGFAAHGHASAALLHHAAGHHARAARSTRRALRASEGSNCDPRHRWFALDTAQRLGSLNSDLTRELNRLKRRYQFTRNAEAPLDPP